jgi:hypothetical protein
MPLPRHRTICALATQNREAIEAMMNSNAHDDIA